MSSLQPNEARAVPAAVSLLLALGTVLASVGSASAEAELARLPG